MECTIASTGTDGQNNSFPDRAIHNVNISSATSFNSSSNMSTYSWLSDDYRLYVAIEEILYSRVIPVICVFGLIGNLLNLLVLTRKSLLTTMDRLEKSAHMGLLALAVSDLLFCLSALPHSLADRDRFEYDSVGFWLLYEIYSNAVINVFLMASTWLTVAMAVSRYLAICYPLHGRQLLGATSSGVALGVVFVFCLLFNLPRFWMLRVDWVHCEQGWYSYFASSGYVRRTLHAEHIYMWFYFIFCILAPMVILLYCNLYLIHALRVSARMRMQYTRGRDTSLDSKHIVTLTLIVIVLFYISLVVPAELLNFAKYHVIASTSLLGATQYNLAVAVCNTLQAINFAVNFVLYCVINVNFRRAVRQLFVCSCRHGNKMQQQTRAPQWSMKYTSMMRTTTSTLAYTNDPCSAISGAQKTATQTEIPISY